MLTLATSGAQLGRLQDEIAAADAWNLDSMIEQAMDALRCPPADAEIGPLSGGERRRLEIARSLVLLPSFVLLDEPFAGIDPLTVVDIQKIIADLSEAGIGVLITDHNVRDTLAVTNRAYIISEGRILAAGTPVQLSANADVRRIYLGEGFRLN